MISLLAVKFFPFPANLILKNVEILLYTISFGRGIRWYETGIQTLHQLLGFFVVEL